MNNTETLYFTDIEDFVSSVMCEFNELDLVNFDKISIISSASQVADLVTEFIRYGMDIGDINISAPDYDLYDGEYVITLSSLDLWCEKFKRDGEYFNVDGTIVYVSNDANSKCLSHVKGDKIYYFEIGEDEELDVDTDADAEFSCSKSCENYFMCGADGHEDDADYTVTIKANIDADEAMKVIDEMEKRINRMCNTFDEMFMFDNFFRRRRL